MGSLSNYAENKWLDHILKTASFTQPTNIYVALSTADPTETGGGLTEPVGNGYARVVCNSWAVAASRTTSNSIAVNFAAASGSWGTITHYAIMDAVSGGNMIGYGSLSTPNSVVNGNVVVFAIGEIDVTVNTGAFTNYLANKMLDHTFKTAAYTVPTNIYVALSTANPTDTGAGASEPAGNGYARTLCNVWNAAAAGATANTGAITFPTATGSWGTITHAQLYDASTVGNPLLYGALGVSQAVVNGNVVEYDVGALQITLD